MTVAASRASAASSTNCCDRLVAMLLWLIRAGRFLQRRIGQARVRMLAANAKCRAGPPNPQAKLLPPGRKCILSFHPIEHGWGWQAGGLAWNRNLAVTRHTLRCWLVPLTAHCSSSSKKE